MCGGPLMWAEPVLSGEPLMVLSRFVLGRLNAVALMSEALMSEALMY